MFGDVRFPAPSGPTPSLRSAVAAPVRLQTYRNLLYLSLAFPLGLAYFVFFAVGFSLGVSLAFVVVGIPLLLFVLAAALGLASVERKLAALLLGVSVPSPERPDDDSLTARARRLVVGRRTWKAVAYLASKFAFGVVSFSLITSLLVTAVSLLVVPFVYDRPGVYVGLLASEPAVFRPELLLGWDGALVGVRAAFSLTSWEVTTLAEALAVAGFGVVLAVAALNVLNALAWLSGRYTVWLLGDDAAADSDADSSPAA